MFNKPIVLLFFLAHTLIWGQQNIYVSDRFDDLASNQRELAIIPFLVNLDLKEAVSPGELLALEEREGKAVQNALETYFSKRKMKKKFSVDFQDTKNTNAILAKHEITYRNIDIYTPRELCKILEVDGIISGTMELNILLSEGIPAEFSILDYFSGDADYGRIGIKISDGNSGKLLWKYEMKITKKSGKNTADLIDRMMRNAARKFPYDRERKRDRKKENDRR